MGTPPKARDYQPERPARDGLSRVPLWAPSDRDTGAAQVTLEANVLRLAKAVEKANRHLELLSASMALQAGDYRSMLEMARDQYRQSQADREEFRQALEERSASLRPPTPPPIVP